MSEYFKNDWERKSALNSARKLNLVVLVIVFAMMAVCVYQLFFRNR